MIITYNGSGKYITKIFTLSLICLAVVGCGADEDDNTQPVLEAIADKTLDVGDETRVDINITDADIDDTHTIRASSDDTTIATVSVNDAMLTIIGIADGTTTVTVSVTDDSGQENAAATPLVFQVTVDANVQPVLEAIADRTLDVGDETMVDINITDADVDDTHTIRATSDDMAIVTVSVKDMTLTINGIADGMTTITINAMDDSGQENAAATPLVVQVTVDANVQPVIETISDRTLDVGDETMVDINITDADVDDTHTASASSDDTAIATVSVNDTTLTIKGIADGTTTVTVSVTDDSGQENATATPVTFEVIIRGNTVPRDPSFSDLVEAWGNDDLVAELFNRATKLRAGLEFPIDTFAVNEELTILVAHTPDGTGLVLVGAARFEAGGDMQLGWLTFVNRGAVRVLTHYDP